MKYKTKYPTCSSFYASSKSKMSTQIFGKQLKKAYHSYPTSFSRSNFVQPTISINFLFTYLHHEIPFFQNTEME